MTQQPTALEALETRLASEHANHITGPVLPCPLCFQPALRLGADPRPRLVTIRQAIPTPTSLPQTAAA
jgi:hypothetical protein